MHTLSWDLPHCASLCVSFVSISGQGQVLFIEHSNKCLVSTSEKVNVFKRLKAIPKQDPASRNYSDRSFLPWVGMLYLAFFFFNVLTSLKKIKYFLYVMTRNLEFSQQHSYL